MTTELRPSSGGQITGARVLPAHLESNFINPDYKGAQPAACLRSIRASRPSHLAPRASRDPLRAHSGTIPRTGWPCA